MKQPFSIFSISLQRPTSLMGTGENRTRLPYVLKEDLLDLLGGGLVVSLPDERFNNSSVLANLVSRGFNPTTYVYYSNDTKEADTEC